MQMLPPTPLARRLTVNRSVSEKVDNKAGEVGGQIAGVSAFYMGSF